MKKTTTTTTTTTNNTTTPETALVKVSELKSGKIDWSKVDKSRLQCVLQEHNDNLKREARKAELREKLEKVNASLAEAVEAENSALVKTLSEKAESLAVEIKKCRISTTKISISEGSSALLYEGYKEYVTEAGSQTATAKFATGLKPVFDSLGLELTQKGITYFLRQIGLKQASAGDMYRKLQTPTAVKKAVICLLYKHIVKYAADQNVKTK